MAGTIFGERRTRSQLTLPDDLLLRLPQRSPMKDARSARRHLVPQSNMHQLETADNSLDGLASSANNEKEGKGKSNPKRSMSPTQDTEMQVPRTEPPPERELKRAKVDVDVVENSESTLNRRAGVATRRKLHARNASDPNSSRMQRSTRTRSTTPAGSIKPVSSTGVTSLSTIDLPPSKGRAQSVPIFPTYYPSPFVDLKNPPPSPRRTRSRSPEREERRLRITFEPTKLDAFVDEAEEKMAVEEEGTLIPSAAKDVSQQPEIILESQPMDMRATASEDLINNIYLENTTNIHPNSPPTVFKRDIRSTPPPTCLIPSVTLSPLTPLPETPHPSKFRMLTKDWKGQHLIASNGPEEQAEENTASIMAVGTSEPTPPVTNPSLTMTRTSPPPQSRLANSRYATLMGLSSTSSMSSTSNPGPSGINRSSLLVLGRGSSSSSDSNAFSVLMQARRGTGRIPARGDENKVKRSMESSVSNASESPKSNTDNAGESRIEPLGDNPRRSTLRTRMRPREKPKIEVVPAFHIAQEDESGDRTGSKQTSNDQEAPATPVMFTVNQMEPPLVATVEGHRAPSPESTPSITGGVAQWMPSSELVSMTHHRHDEAHAKSDGEHSSMLGNQGGLAVGSTRVVGGRVIEGGVELQAEQHYESSDTASRHINTEPDASAKKGRLRLTRKHLPATIIPVGRITRSTASKMKAKELVNAPPALRSSTPVTLADQGSAASIPEIVEESKSEAAARVDNMNQSGPADNASSPPGSSMRTSSPVRKLIDSNYARPTTSSAAKVTKTPTRGARLSPYKHGRNSPIRLSRPPSTSSLPFSTSFVDQGRLGATSSLSTLANALEKLRKPPPSRPNTSLGFHDQSDESIVPQEVSSSDGTTLGKERPSSSTKLRPRSSSFSLPTSTSSSSSRITKPQSSVQRPISAFLTGKQGFDSTNDVNLFAKPGNGLPPRPKFFGVGGGGVFGMGMKSRAHKVSRKTSLPMVVGSPVKGGEIVNTADDYTDVVNVDDHSLEIVMDIVPDAKDLDIDEYFVPIAADSAEETGKNGKDDINPWKTSSRRASLASLALSESLNALPPKGTMGPPPMIPRHGQRITRSVSSSYASVTQSAEDKVQSGRRRTGSVVITGSRSSEGDSRGSDVSSSLKFMKDCVVFVDVRTDDGDDAGSLFVEMLEGTGAKILTRVGQTCTHIIFKNGLLSTISRYRLLRDPKPLVVGIAWVVECVEQRKHVDETNFLIDIADMNVAGVNKRRKSLLPKLVTREASDVSTHDVDNGQEGDGDQSMDGSNSSLVLDDDLPPLEKARRRKSILVGPRS
ncbi:hypothetical protein AX17_004598 [Amanita inopinata Kibby_2008]|nr:hypothetical protein AX17_004598 [Amanita inopinata Kibby_2008]